jgi:hypothetical protein
MGRSSRLIREDAVLERLAAFRERCAILIERQRRHWCGSCGLFPIEEAEVDAWNKACTKFVKDIRDASFHDLGEGLYTADPVPIIVEGTRMDDDEDEEVKLVTKAEETEEMPEG